MGNSQIPGPHSFYGVVIRIRGGSGRGYEHWHLRIVMLGRFLFSFSAITCDFIILVE